MLIALARSIFLRVCASQRVALNIQRHRDTFDTGYPGLAKNRDTKTSSAGPELLAWGRLYKDDNRGNTRGGASRPKSNAHGEASLEKAGDDKRARKQQDRREAVLRLASKLFRERGLNNVTMADIAVEMGASKVVLYRRFGSKEELVAALFEQVMSFIESADYGPWTGYGSRVKARLNAIRQIEDGYVTLVRDAGLYASSSASGTRLRNHSSELIRRTLEFPDPNQAHDPLAANLCLETIVTFSNQALVWWVLHGEPKRDDEFIAYFAWMMRAWREGALQLFGLGNPKFALPTPAAT